MIWYSGGLGNCVLNCKTSGTLHSTKSGSQWCCKVETKHATLAKSENHRKSPKVIGNDQNWLEKVRWHWWHVALMSTLLLYTHISSFLIIYNIHVTFSSTIPLRQYCRMCFEPLEFMRCHSDHFWPFPMFYDVFMEFLMFACLYLTYHYINGLSMHS
jgi:hypothetical protein